MGGNQPRRPSSGEGLKNTLGREEEPAPHTLSDRMDGNPPHRDPVVGPFTQRSRGDRLRHQRQGLHWERQCPGGLGLGLEFRPRCPHLAGPAMVLQAGFCSRDRSRTLAGRVEKEGVGNELGSHSQEAGKLGTQLH